MKILSLFFIILLFIGCSNINNVNTIPPSINLIVQKDKYSLILKHQFYKELKTYDENLAKFTVETNMSFNTSNALSIDGKDNLNIVKGTVDFKIFDTLNTKIIKSGSVSTSINTGNVSSLYSIDENNNFAKERMSKYLASKLYRMILLSIKNSES